MKNLVVNKQKPINYNFIQCSQFYPYFSHLPTYPCFPQICMARFNPHRRTLWKRGFDLFTLLAVWPHALKSEPTVKGFSC